MGPNLMAWTHTNQPMTKIRNLNSFKQQENLRHRTKEIDPSPHPKPLLFWRALIGFFILFSKIKLLL
jgi:hypothetical protein